MSVDKMFRHNFNSFQITKKKWKIVKIIFKNGENKFKNMLQEIKLSAHFSTSFTTVNIIL